MKYYWVCFENLSNYGYSKHDTVVNEHPFTFHKEDSSIRNWLNQFGKVHVLLNWKEITEEEYKLHPEGEE